MENAPYILITEDDADDRFLIQTAFAEKNYSEKLVFTENGVELLNYLHNLVEKKENFPLLILLDLNMPKKDGRESLREIKQSDALRNIPVFIFTTTHSEQEIYRCTQLGADRYIVKPVTFEGLVYVIDEIHEFCARQLKKV